MALQSKPISNLGYIAATLIRATEQSNPPQRRIFDASADVTLLPPVWRLFLLPGIRQLLIAFTERRLAGSTGMLLCRTRYLDDALISALGKGVEQVVILGAGFDSHAYRIPGVEKTRVFESDLPMTMELKQERLEMVFGAVPEHVTLVGVDYNDLELSDRMMAAGFRPGVPTIIICEGLIQYISADAVDSIFRFAALAAPGSEIAFTYIHRGIVDGTARSPAEEKLLANIRRRGMSWVFGLDPAEVEDWLTARGFRLTDHAGVADYRDRYLISPGRTMDIYAGERMALAEVIGG